MTENSIRVFYGKDWLISHEDGEPVLRLRTNEIVAYKLNSESNTSVWLKGTDRVFEVRGDATKTLDTVFGLTKDP